jgi:hypothetical protein
MSNRHAQPILLRPPPVSIKVHGIEHCIKKRCVYRRSTPRLLISQPPDQCFPAHRSLSPQRSRSLVTAFRSPATKPPSRMIPFQGQRSRPVPSRPPSYAPTARSAPGSTPSAGLPQSEDASSPFARCCVQLASLPGCFRSLHSPPGLLPPSGSKRSTASAALRLAFRFRPMSSRSPLPFYL